MSFRNVCLARVADIIFRLPLELDNYLPHAVRQFMACISHLWAAHWFLWVSSTEQSQVILLHSCYWYGVKVFCLFTTWHSVSLGHTSGFIKVSEFVTNAMTSKQGISAVYRIKTLFCLGSQCTWAHNVTRTKIMQLWHGLGKFHIILQICSFVLPSVPRKIPNQTKTSKAMQYTK